MRSRFAVLFAALALSGVGVAAAQETEDTPRPVTKPDCRGYKALAAKTYDTERWWRYADPTPARGNEAKRLDAFRREGCKPRIRRDAKARYGRFYRTAIAPCKGYGRRFANCAVALCESEYRTTSRFTHGFTVYWSAIGALPPWGNRTRTGRRFAPSEAAATLVESNVFAAAAFKFGPTPGTCAS